MLSYGNVSLKLLRGESKSVVCGSTSLLSILVLVILGVVCTVVLRLRVVSAAATAVSLLTPLGIAITTAITAAVVTTSLRGR